MHDYTEIKISEYIIRIHNNGSEEWYKNGDLHREDGPAVKDDDGTEYWFLNGAHHRVDGPAIKDAYGNEYWYKNGKLHREDGPAIKYSNGDESYYLMDILSSKKEYELISIFFKINCI